MALGDPISFDTFCDAYLASFRALKSQFKEEIAHAFRFFTTDSCDGAKADVTCDQLFEALQEFVPFDIDRERFDATFTSIDQSGNGDGRVSSDEFVSYLLKSADTISNTHSGHLRRSRRLSSVIVADRAVSKFPVAARGISRSTLRRRRPRRGPKCRR